MGNSSSQIAPTQVPEDGGTQALGPSGSPLKASPKSSKKRKAATFDEEDAHIPTSKRLKANQQRAEVERVIHRAIPQHRRGTAIKPREESTARELPNHGDVRKEKSAKPTPHISKHKDSHTSSHEGVRWSPSQQLVDDSNKAVKLAPKPARPMSKTVEKKRNNPHPQVVIVSTARPGRRRTGPTVDKVASVDSRKAQSGREIGEIAQIQKVEAAIDKSGMPETGITTSTQSDHQPTEKASAATKIWKEGSVVNPVGQPGPPRRSSTRRATILSSKPDDLPVPKPNQTQVASTRTKARDAVSGAGITPVSNAPSAHPAPSGPEARKAAHSKTQSQLDPRMQPQQSKAGSDGLTGNPIGHPGPKGKISKQQKEAKAQAGSVIVPKARKAKPRVSQARLQDEEDAAASGAQLEPAFPGIGSESPSALRMPTPPKSSEEQMDVVDEQDVEDDGETEHHPDYDPRERPGYVDPTDQVTDWLGSQQASAEQVTAARRLRTQTKVLHKRPKKVSKEFSDDSDEYHDDEQPDTNTEPSPRRKVTAKTKPNIGAPRARAPQPEVDEEYQADEERDPGVNEAPKPKPVADATFQKPAQHMQRQDTRPTAMKQYQSAERGTVTGPWTAAEKELADEVFWNYCQVHEMEAWMLRANTLDWTNIGSFKIDMYEAFPKRTIPAIRKFCQRRFSPYKTGAWTEEWDKALKDAYARYPDQWISISDVIDRAPGACRDRWVHVLQYNGKLERGAWSIEEEAQLVKAVEECKNLIRYDPNIGDDGFDEAKVERMIDWERVATKMDGKRSAKRCYEKWPKIKQRLEMAKEQGEAQAPAPAPTAPTAPLQMEKSNKQKRLDAALSKVEPGDMFDALNEIADAMQKHQHKEFTLESTFWSLAATERPNSKFAGKMRRRIYYTALELYDHKKVRKAVGIVAKSHAMVRRMKKLEKRGQLNLTRGYKMDVVLPKVNGTLKDLPTVEGRPAPEKRVSTVDRVMQWESHAPGQTPKVADSSTRKFLSEANIANSDDEAEQANAGAEQQAGQGEVVSEEEEEYEEEVVDDVEAQDTSMHGEAEHDAAIQEQQEDMDVLDDLPTPFIGNEHAERLRSKTTPRMHPKAFNAKLKAAKQSKRRA